MEKRKELEVKLDLFKHRAFWWVMEDLSMLKGVECETLEAIKSLERIYKTELKEIGENPKYIQTELNIKS